MAVSRWLRWLVSAAALAALTVGSSLGSRNVSATTTCIGSDHIVSWTPLPDEMGLMCLIPETTASYPAPQTRGLIVSRGDSIAIYDSTASGNDQPLRVIKGPDNSGGMFAAAYNGLVFARTSSNAIGVWSVYDSGAVPPRFKIGEGVAIEIRGVAIDPEGQNVISSDKHLNALISWHVPEVFALAKGAQTEGRRAPAN